MEFDLGAPGSVVGTGQTWVIGMIPTPSSIDMIQLSGQGVSGTPTGIFQIQRFIVGAGYTVFSIGSTFAITSYGTSGVLSLSVGVSLPQIGSTLTTLYANDVVMYLSGGANSACSNIVGGVVLRPIQDIVKYYNVI
jgi:hypothetical protein